MEQLFIGELIVVKILKLRLHFSNGHVKEEKVNSIISKMLRVGINTLLRKKVLFIKKDLKPKRHPM